MVDWENGKSNGNYYNRVYIRVYGLCWDNGKYNGNYSLMYWGYNAQCEALVHLKPYHFMAASRVILLKSLSCLRLRRRPKLHWRGLVEGKFHVAGTPLLFWIRLLPVSAI